MAQGTFTLPDGQLTDRHFAASAGLRRALMEQRVLAKKTIPLTDWRVWDAVATPLSGTPAADDLGLVNGAFGVSPSYIGSGDVKATSATRYARAIIPLPDDYEAGQTVTLRLVSGMLTTVADTSASVDAEVWRVDEDGTLGAADLCTTAAISVNSLDEADRDFTITPGTLNPGDQLDVRIRLATVDAATATAVIAAIYATILMCDRR